MTNSCIVFPFIDVMLVPDTEIRWFVPTRNSSVDEIGEGERYRLNNAIVVKLHHLYTQFPP